MPKISKLNLVFAAELILFFLIIFGVVPRYIAFGIAGMLVIYPLLTSLENATILFVRSIPIFIALPLTSSFDNFNTWRIVSSVIFLKWLYVNRGFVISHVYALIQKPFVYLKNHPVTVLFGALFLFAALSVFPATDKTAAIKRIIYFINAGFVGIVACHLFSKLPDFKMRVIKNIVVPIVVIIVFGFFQLILTYFVDIYQFMRIFGEGIQCRQFGQMWCSIASHLGNTWFAYYGDQLSLRMFSLFPDSHSFPIFLLLGIPSIVALKSIANGWWRVSWWLLLIFVFLGAILSGTRGIWLAWVGTVLWGIIVWYYIRKHSISTVKFSNFKKILVSLGIFFLLFGVAYPIAYSPQFLISKSDRALLRKRISSIFDFGETSNTQRLLIWKASLKSIVKHPALGIGIGNFPVVLNQDIKLSKAGSSAHNLYLHIAAEMGLLALVAALWFLIVLIQKIFRHFRDSPDTFLTHYYGGLLFVVPWVLLYLLTDVALYDERALLLFVMVCALILPSHGNQTARIRNQSDV